MIQLRLKIFNQCLKIFNESFKTKFVKGLEKGLENVGTRFVQPFFNIAVFLKYGKLRGYEPFDAREETILYRMVIIS